jgi:NADH-quinone oxidoreductase subunit L
MFRLYFLTFQGTFRGSKHQQEHLHESPKSMTIPLIILAILSVIGGFLGTPAWLNHLLGTSSWFEHHLSFLDGPIIHEASAFFEYTVLIVSIVVLIVIVTWLKKLYVTQGAVPESDEQEKGIQKILSHKYYVDELYDLVFVRPINFISRNLWTVADKQIIDGAVETTGKAVTETGKFSRLFQSGMLELYMIAMVFGLVLVFVIQFMK